MVLNADTDGDLRPAATVREDAPGTPAETAGQEDANGADFVGVSSRELGETARRLVDALAHRTDEAALAEIHRLSESLGAVLADPSRPTAQDGSWPEADSTEPNRDPVWDRWFR